MKKSSRSDIPDYTCNGYIMFAVPHFCSIWLSSLQRSITITHFKKRDPVWPQGTLKHQMWPLGPSGSSWDTGAGHSLTGRRVLKWLAVGRITWSEYLQSVEKFDSGQDLNSLNTKHPPGPDGLSTDLPLKNSRNGSCHHLLSLCKKRRLGSSENSWQKLSYIVTSLSDFFKIYISLNIRRLFLLRLSKSSTKSLFRSK